MAGITDKEVRAVISRAIREGKTVTQADGTIPGLTLAASKTGTGSWVVRYRIAGKQKEATIGQYPTWGIADARAKAKDLRRAVDEGVDVALEKQKKKQEALQASTVDMLAAEYFAKAEKGMALKTGMRPHTLKQRKSIHERYVSPQIGRFEASTITPAQVVNVVKKAEAGGKTLPDITLTHCNLILESVELATLEWVSWFNHHRLLEPIGYIPPAEAEANYYRQLANQAAIVA